MKRVVALAVTASFVLVGCGGVNSNSNNDSNNSNHNEQLDRVGYFIDAAVVGADYNGSLGSSGTTQSGGKFNFKPDENITFSLGKLKLGSVKLDNNITNGVKITPVDLAKGYHVDKPSLEINNTKAIQIAKVLQNADSDHNATNGIEISDNTKQEIDTRVDAHDIPDTVNENDSIDEAKIIAEALGKSEINATKAKQHFEETIKNEIENDSNNMNNHSDNNQENSNQDNGNGSSVDNNTNGNGENDSNNMNDNNSSETNNG